MAQAYFVGSGIASLAGAAYLIRDGHFPGNDIHIFEQSAITGGSLDGAGSPEADRVLGIRLETLSGLLAGLQGQPAVLAFAFEKVGNERPNLGYATVYSLAMLLKILFAQLLLGG